MQKQQKYKIIWLEETKKDLRNISKSEVEKILKKVESQLSANPHSGLKMVGKFKGLNRIRIGDYRVIYSIEDLTITVSVIRVGHRKDVYTH
jgi:mRNA interferase RelE/StbE